MSDWGFGTGEKESARVEDVQTEFGRSGMGLGDRFCGGIGRWTGMW